MTAFRAFGEAAADRGLHLGDGVFETVLVAAGRAAFLAEHLARLDGSCRALGILEPPGGVSAAVSTALPAMWTEEGRPPRAALRISVTRGAWTGFAPDPTAQAGLFLVLRALAETPARPLDAVVLDQPRIDPASPLAGHKTLSWMAHVEARRRAALAGGQVALLRTLDGDIAEADAANLFVVLGGQVITPPLDRGILPGITRRRALEAIRASGRPSAERRVRPGDLALAGEAFLTSSLAGIVPLRAVDGRTLPSPPAVADWLAGCLEPDDACG